VHAITHLERFVQNFMKDNVCQRKKYSSPLPAAHTTKVVSTRVQLLYRRKRRVYRQ
jgi:hypothetical protein